ncbi:hypothetical protein [Enterobacter sp. ENT03]|uniref:hypothetical protein n=1 Tax=Enterobacter sp. ENT03 TaxID=2854780 RepID=UPI0021098503|nr:hypothetical protein [Enterobacter sp. ENT03]
MKQVTIENVTARITDLATIQSSTTIGISLREEFELACMRELLAAMQAAEAQKPGEYLTHVVDDGVGEYSDRMNFSLPIGTDLYAAPQLVAVPDGYVLVPNRLTAENGAKSAMSGEFSETKFINCPECFGDEECETCDGSGRIEITLPVSWTNIKAIWEKAVEHFAATHVNPEYSTHLVGEVVARNHPNHERNVDFRWLDFNVEPGTKLYAIKQERS